MLSKLRFDELAHVLYPAVLSRVRGIICARRAHLSTITARREFTAARLQVFSFYVEYLQLFFTSVNCQYTRSVL